LSKRLENLNKGIDTGFKGEDVNNLYDEPLFSKKVVTNIYSNVR